MEQILENLHQILIETFEQDRLQSRLHQQLQEALMPLMVLKEFQGEIERSLEAHRGHLLYVLLEQRIQVTNQHVQQKIEVAIEGHSRGASLPAELSDADVLKSLLAH
jgi:hypothetical protein